MMTFLFERQAATLIGQTGQPAMEFVLLALKNPKQEEGALLALDAKQLPVPPATPIEEYTRTAVSHAVMYDTLMRGVKV